MNDQSIKLPKFYTEIQKESERINFTMPSDLQTGSLLRTLVAAKPSGDFLELGTGTGLSLAWIAEAMDENSKAISIDNNEQFVGIAEELFGKDPRIEIICTDGNEFIKEYKSKKFDLIFADAWPGKYSLIEKTLSLLKIGGIYLIDDMLPQPNWPAGHEDNVEKLLVYLESRKDLQLTKMSWSTGIVIVTKTQYVK